MARYLGAQCAALHSESSCGTALWAVRCWRCGCRPAGPFRGQPGATHLGATVMRIRGYIVPSEVFDVTGGAGVCGIRVDTWNTDVTDLNNQPFLQPDYDWMAWLPWNVGATGPTVLAPTSPGNQYASEWAVDVKSNRKLEELNETLWLFGDQTGAGERTYFYHLSIGMKLCLSLTLYGNL